MPVQAQVQRVEEAQILNIFTEPVRSTLPADESHQQLVYSQIVSGYRNSNTYLVSPEGIFVSSASTTTCSSVHIPSALSPMIVTSSTATSIVCQSTSGTFVAGSFFSAGYWATDTDGLQSPESLVRYARLQQRRKRQDALKAKSSIKRALKLMCNIGFEEEARIFLKGQTIEVSHPDSLFKFVIAKHPNSLIAKTVFPGYSTPYQLSLYTKSDIYVARLCVYMEQTPILDQVMALAMFIKSGSEEEILKAANWFSKSNDPELFEIITLEYPYLKSKLR